MTTPYVYVPNQIPHPADQAVRNQYTPPAASLGVLGVVTFLIKEPGSEVLGTFVGATMVCKLATGHIYYEGQLALDTDGSRFAAVDGTGNAGTAWQPGGVAIDNDAIPYFSVTIPVFDDARFGLKKGDFAVVIRGSMVRFAVLADVGGASLGEGSLELHRQLGHECIIHRGTAHERLINASIDSGVITIAFPRSGNGHRPTNASVAAAGRTLWRSLQLMNIGDFPLPPRDTRYA